jgi:hypothetical protein
MSPLPPTHVYEGELAPGRSHLALKRREDFILKFFSVPLCLRASVVIFFVLFMIHRSRRSKMLRVGPGYFSPVTPPNGT